MQLGVLFLSWPTPPSIPGRLKGNDDACDRVEVESEGSVIDQGGGEIRGARRDEGGVEVLSASAHLGARRMTTLTLYVHFPSSQ